MTPGASTPEELESLLEDGFLLGRGTPLAGLFERSATIGIDGESNEARGGQEIALLANELCARGFSYLAGPRRVLQAGNTALVLAEHAVNVVRRGADGSWRYSISLLTLDTTTKRSRQ
jgi:hypothetical protein